MFIEIYADAEELGRSEAMRIARLIREKKNPLLCVPAGQSYICVFKALIELYRKGEVDFSEVKFVGLDEWCGFDAYESSAGWILDTSFFNFVNVRRENMRLFDPNPQDPQAECRAVERYIEENGGIDYLALGVGMNGHVGLNEPGADFSLGAHVNRLAQKTLEVSEKYFQDGIPPLKEGMTLGFGNFFEAREIVVALNGIHKAPVVEKFMKTPVTNEYPVTNMKTCPRTRLLLDQAAASQIYIV